MSMTGDYRDLIRALKEQGFEVVTQRRRPHMNVLKDGHVVGTLPCSPSDHRALKNDVARLKRVGFIAPRKDGRNKERSAP